MPSKTLKQHNFMAAVANNPEFAKKAGVPQSVGKEFSEADTGRKFSKGGDTMASKMNPGFMAMMAKKKGAPAKKMAGGGKKMMDGGMAYAKGGSASSRADGIAKQGKTKGSMIAMKNGGKC
jgi:hypothetical protein